MYCPNIPIKPLVLLCTLVLFGLISFSQKTASPKQPQNPPHLNTNAPETSSESSHISSSTFITVFLPIVCALLGALAGAGVSIWYSKQQTKREYRTLILAFGSEAVLAFERCVMYYEQFSKGPISKSALFSFTDASIFSKFASVCDKPELTTAIIKLKSSYFQISRHVEEASKFAVQMESTLDPAEQKAMVIKAKGSQGTAMAFFRDHYEGIVKNVALILQAAQHLAPASLAYDLLTQFSDAKKKKEKIDAQREK